MNIVASLVCGLIFGAGLLISGMTQPAKVLGFLDILGRWDPTLAFVMAGALAVSAAGFALARRASAPFFAARHQWPTRKDIDRPLVVGSVLFGLGWGLVGLCPGPAVVNIASLSPRVLLFVLAMVGGMALQGWWRSRAERTQPRSGQQPALAPSDG
ncbi:YeeE/YedE family protein [Enhydrobacter sp.]|jgi:uncharacterized membrane protein YedE/YeeE|uniref:YeeE/YedE family protein n=1 Tax=Enhydrobacter sp. TaxID=1894999 RepID=UPI002616D65B|nr:YeeE/YedE family protein [Enhydrobacter sp.]WIM13602.1 MAG: hypothetical protein OJF58_004570 [Enhydrobacter sp.]